MGRKLTPELITQIQDAARAGRTCGDVAKEFGVSKATVSKYAKEIDAGFERSQTKKATEAAVVNHAARRAALAQEQLSLAELATKRAKHMIDEASAREASLIAAIAIDKYTKLDQYDSDTQNLSAFDTWIAGIVGTDSIEAPEPTPAKAAAS